MAHLARLELKDEDAEGLKEDMNKILGYMEKLSELDTSNVQPMEHVTEQPTILRKDEAKEPLSHEDALKNAPDADSDYFRVPKVIE